MRFYCEDKTLDIGAGDVVFLPQGKAPCIHLHF
jgi:ethanolamine utilization protein EutQ (cupin superfamily)